MPKDTTPGTKASKDKFNIHLIKPDPKINNGNEQLAIFFGPVTFVMVTSHFKQEIQSKIFIIL